MPPTKKKAKKRRARRSPPEKIFVSPEWNRACEDIARAYGANALAATISPLGTPGTKTATRLLHHATEITNIVRRALHSFLPEAMGNYDAHHPPCPLREIRCMRSALLEVIALDRFERGDVRNPGIEYNLMAQTVNKYLKGLS